MLISDNNKINLFFLNIFYYSVIFLSLIQINAKEDSNIANKKSDKEKKIEKDSFSKQSKKDQIKEDKQKKVRGYFGTKTAFFDKDGKPKLLNKDFKSLTFEELDHNRNIHLTKKIDIETIIRYTERMIALCKDPIRIGKLRIEVADFYFDIARFDRAAAFYTEFSKLYPGNAEAERAIYRNILSKYEDTLPADKDQSLTLEVLKLCKEFIDNQSYKKYRNEVSKIIKKSKKKLLDHNLNIFNYYIDKGNLQAAQKRFENIEKEYLSNSESDKFIKEELEKQIKALKDKKKYKPQYEITSNSSILDFFITTKKDDIEVDNETKVNNDLKVKKEEVKRKKIDYVTKL